MNDTFLLESELWPCDTCPKATHCRREHEACRQLVSFITYGGRRWTREPCEPSRAIYSAIYATPGRL